MAKVEAIFYCGKDPLGLATRAVLGGTYSHCGILIERSVLYDVDLFHPFGPRALPWPPYDFTLVPLNLSPEEEARGWEYLRQNEGFNYSMWENIRYLYSRGEDDRYRNNCAEMLWNYVLYAKMQLRDDPRCLRPDQVYHMIQAV